MHDDYPVQVGDPASDDCVHTTVGELPTGKACMVHLRAAAIVVFKGPV